MVDTPLPGQGSALRAIPRLLLALIVLATGVALAYGGISLLKLGGSAYYLIAGLAYLVLGVLVLLRHRYTAAFSLLVFVATAVWALLDTPRFGYWELLPRLVFPALVLMMTLWSGAAYPGVSAITRRLGNSGALASTRSMRRPRSRRNPACR